MPHNKARRFRLELDGGRALLSLFIGYRHLAPHEEMVAAIEIAVREEGEGFVHAGGSTFTAGQGWAPLGLNTHVEMASLGAFAAALDFAAVLMRPIAGRSITDVAVLNLKEV